MVQYVRRPGRLPAVRAGRDSQETLEEAKRLAVSPFVGYLLGAARDLRWQVRYETALNRYCPSSALGPLAGDGDQRVRAAAAGNPNCPVALLPQLAADRGGSVRLAVALRPDCPAGLLDRLGQDRSTKVRWAALSNKNFCSPEALAAASASSNRSIRLAAADNQGCPPAVLERLLRDRVDVVVQAAAANPSLPRAALAMWQLIQR